MNKSKCLVLILAVLFMVGISLAIEPQAQEKKTIHLESPTLSVTNHSIRINGQAVAYTATVGELVISKTNEKPGAKIFFMAYTRDDIKDKSKRPLTFTFNGGPGSSSVWLHMGGIGPRRIKMTENGASIAPPFGLEDNEYSILDVTDLVFIDPVSTGYSRPLPGENKSQFHGINEDIASVGEFIRHYVTKFERWSSPKFLLGESYGTFRSAGLSGFLQGRQQGMYLNGIILVSSVLDFSTIGFAPHNNIPYVLFLPQYTATAWFHKALSPDLQSKTLREVLDEVENFALEDYSVALLKGNRLGKEEYDDVASSLARYTGLSKEFVLQSNLRIPHSRFVKELLRTDFRTVGRLDSRFKGRDADAAGEGYEFDPSSAVIHGSFSTMLKDYLRRELKYKKNIPYNIYGNVQPWNFTAGGAQPGRRSLSMNPNTAETLRRAMSENEFLRVFVANGYYDGATPYFGTEYTFSQIGLNSEFKDSVTMGYYEAGHMMYIHKPSLIKLKKDLTEFYRVSTLR